jgi:hypothetical protein
VSGLHWYEAFPLWKAAVFCDANYKQHLRGERTNDWTASLREGVPRLLDLAVSCLTG